MLVRFFIVLQAIHLAYTANSTINKQCRDLLQCSITQKCVNLPWLVDKLDEKTITAEMYNDIDAATDYGCIFSSGCQEECNRCPLCFNSKQQVVEILSGTRFNETDECHDLLDCAGNCVAKSAEDLTMINRCLRHTCAYHCFDGSCPKCSGFVTRIFNQMCVSGNFRKSVKGFDGQCFELFREIVHEKFRSEFDKTGKAPAIG
ncbi:unnamed protein product [Auanema sp. JU1783]|nr:unnamed protein product [Auanema sp. JU1783]